MPSPHIPVELVTEIIEFAVAVNPHIWSSAALDEAIRATYKDILCSAVLVNSTWNVSESSSIGRLPFCA